MIFNPISAQTVTFLSMTPDSLLTRFEVEPGRPADPRHIHPLQVETITVIEGRILGRFPDKTERVLGPGQRWEIPAGSSHTWTTIDEHVQLHIDFHPALRTRLLMTRLFGFAEVGKTNSRGIPGPLQVAVTALEYEREFRLASPPWGVQKVLFSALAPLARTFGYQP